MRTRSLLLRLALAVAPALIVCGCGGSDAATTGPSGGDPIVIGTANSLSGPLATFEGAINDGIDIAAAEVNAAGGVGGRPIRVIHVDAKSDLNVAATAALEVMEDGADVVVPICDADLGAPGARAANAKGVLAITCAGAPGLGRQTIGPLTFNTFTGSPTEAAALAEFAYDVKGWRTAYALCDQFVEYSKVVCEAFTTRWRELGGELVGEDTFLQTDTSIAAQVTKLEGSDPDVVLLASYPGGSPALKQLRAAYTGPLLLTAAYSGTFWLDATPHLSDAWAPAVGSSYGDDPRPEINAFFEEYERSTGGPALVDSYPLQGYALVQTIVKGVGIAGSTDGAALAKALESFRDVPLITGPTTYTSTCHVPVGRRLLMIEFRDGAPASTGRFVTPRSVPEYPC